MALDSKHLEFTFIRFSDSGKTKIWVVVNTTTVERIGLVKWAGNFRKYAFFPNEATAYDSNCLQDIAAFLQEVTSCH